MATIDELIVVLGIDLNAADLAKVDALKVGMEKLEKWALRASVAVAAATTTFAYWLKTIGKDSEGLVRLSDMTGISTDEIQKLSYATEQLGGNSEALKGDILNLQKTMTSPIPGVFNENLLMLGVATRDAGGGVRKVEDVLGDLSERFGKMNSQQALQWGTKLGLSQDTIRLLQQGREGVEKLKKQAEALGGIIPNEALRASIKFNQGLKDIWFSIKGITTQMGLSFLPTLAKIIDKFRDWLTVNREWLKLKLSEVISGISAGFERAWNVIKKITDAVFDFGKKILYSLGLMKSLKNTTELFVTGGLIGLAALAVALLPFYLSTIAMIAAVVLLGLAIDDLIAYFSGGKSVIGKFFESFEEHFPALYDFFGWLLKFLKDVLPPVLGFLKNVWSSWLKGEIMLLYLVLSLMDKITSKMGFGANKGIGAKSQDQSTHHQWLADVFKYFMTKPQDQISRMAIGKKSAGGGSTVHNNQKISINVQGASNPQQTAELVYGHLSSVDVNSPGQFSPVTG